MIRKFIIAAAFLFLIVDVTASVAQRRQTGGSTMTRGQSPQMNHRFEIIPFGGYVWTLSRRITFGIPAQTGDLDIKDSGFWGVEMAFNVRPGSQVTLLYQRQNSDLTFKTAGTTNNLGELGVEYWHIGGIGGVPKDNVFAFTGLSLGGTRYIARDSGGVDWKFSMILRLGAKVYLNERLGLLVQARMPYTFTNGGLAIGTGGVSFGGTGIAQLDLSAGLMINM